MSAQIIECVIFTNYDFLSNSLLLSTPWVYPCGRGRTRTTPGPGRIPTTTGRGGRMMNGLVKMAIGWLAGGLAMPGVFTKKFQKNGDATAVAGLYTTFIVTRAERTATRIVGTLISEQQNWKESQIN